MKCLKLTLAGTLPSFGTSESSWSEYKNTAPLPTETAVTGLIGCAMGIKRGDPKLGQLSSDLTMYVETHAKGENKEEPDFLDFEIFSDYQIVSPRGSKVFGRDRSPEKFVTADLDAKGKKGKSQLPITKEYIQNGRFHVYIAGEEDLLKRIHTAFLSPKWMVYIGRACCTPSEYIVEREFSTEDEDEVKRRSVCISR